jgi:hypothetical protein
MKLKPCVAQAGVPQHPFKPLTWCCLQGIQLVRVGSQGVPVLIDLNRLRVHEHYRTRRLVEQIDALSHESRIAHMSSHLKYSPSERRKTRWKFGAIPTFVSLRK